MRISYKRKRQLFYPAIGVLSLVSLSDVASSEQHSLLGSAVDYDRAIGQLQHVIDEELENENLTGLSIAMIDGQEVVLGKGFGLADKELRVPAESDTVYRVGSISKLFTALAAMQIEEKGMLDLDAPLQHALPDFQIVDPFGSDVPITLRQLMCHRSGIVRESPVGGYFDDSQPSDRESIASLKDCVLVNPPNTKTRYSNIAVTAVGQSVAVATNSQFEQYQREHVLDPLGMTHSSWQVDDRMRDKLAVGYMRIADGQGEFTRCPAKTFELGMIPAGNLYSSVDDMSLFAKMLLANGALPNQGKIVQPETLSQMFIPQLTDEDTGYGLGFFIGKHREHRTVQHTGAVYGFSSSLVVLPEPQIAVVILANEDLASGSVKRISEAALDLMLSTKNSESIPEEPTTLDMDKEQLAKFVGQYESSSYWAEINIQGNKLNVVLAGQPTTARPIGPLRIEINGRLHHRGILEFEQDEDDKILGFQAFGQRFDRVPLQSSEIPTGWQKYLGSYGPEFIPLVISERHGHLYAMTENMFDYRLKPVNATVFEMPEGLYADEHLIFELDRSGKVHAVTLANMRLERHP